MHLAASAPRHFLDFKAMKILAATVLVLLLAVTPLGVAVADEPVASDNITSILPNNGPRSADLDTAAPTASALDLSLFGIITLGVLGLFWIRRHTSEL